MRDKKYPSVLILFLPLFQNKSCKGKSKFYTKNTECLVFYENPIQIFSFALKLIFF